MTKLILEVEHCGDCPFHFTERYYTGDSFEMAFDYFCGDSMEPEGNLKFRNQNKNIKNRRIASYVDSTSELKKRGVPPWCPYRIDREEALEQYRKEQKAEHLKDNGSGI